MSGRYFLQSVAENYNVSQRVPTCPGHGVTTHHIVSLSRREGHVYEVTWIETIMERI